MNIEEILSSGVIEMYCLGLASDDEKKFIEDLASKNKTIREEIASVNEALRLYALASEKSPASSLKNKILDAIKNSETIIAFPPRITLDSDVSEWMKYITENNISAPKNFEVAHIVDLPGNEKQSTYVAWAKKGAVIEEEHSDEDEYLLMINGYCSVTIDGVIGYYKEGDVVFIPNGCLHRAEALSDGIMMLVGQRIAA